MQQNYYHKKIKNKKTVKKKIDGSVTVTDLLKSPDSKHYIKRRKVPLQKGAAREAAGVPPRPPLPANVAVNVF